MSMSSGASPSTTTCQPVARTSQDRSRSAVQYQVAQKRGTSGIASVMNPGLLPVLWMEAPPSSQAAPTSFPNGRVHAVAAVELAPGGGRGMDVHPGQGHVRMLDDGSQRVGPDVPCGPLDNPVRAHGDRPLRLFLLRFLVY
jgi:hypothetical protein